MAARPRFSCARDALRASAAIRRAVSAAGGSIALAQRLRMHPTSIAAWVIRPAHRVEDVEAVSGVSRHDLRPDLYPRPATGLTEAERALPAHLAAGAFFARTGRVLSAEGGAHA